MTKIKKFAALGATALLTLSLTGCLVGDGSQFQHSDVDEFTITTADGTVVPCIKVDQYYGIDCNWDKAVRSNTPKP